MRDSFVFYKSWGEAIRHLPREVQGEVLTAIIEYGLYGETTGQLKPIAKAIMTLVKPQIDSNRNRYENGIKGGRTRKGAAPEDATPADETTEEEPNGNQTVTKAEPNGNQTVTKREPNRNQTRTKPEPNGNQTRTKPEPNPNL